MIQREDVRNQCEGIRDKCNALVKPRKMAAIGVKVKKSILRCWEEARRSRIRFCNDGLGNEKQISPITRIFQFRNLFICFRLRDNQRVRVENRIELRVLSALSIY
jgi:hypothetical protein